MSHVAPPAGESSTASVAIVSASAQVYRFVSVCLSATFAIVGLLFLLSPNQVLLFFNDWSGIVGLKPSPVEGHGFFLILATAYMYLVFLLAVLMVRHPHERMYPILLMNAKSASSLLSLLLFVFAAPYLIVLTNFIVDGAIAGLVAWLRSVQKRISE